MTHFLQLVTKILVIMPCIEFSGITELSGTGTSSFDQGHQASVQHHSFKFQKHERLIENP